MLEDRPYLRDPLVRHTWPFTKALLVLNAACFVLQALVGFHGDLALERYFGLSWDTLASGQVWRLLTFQFLHGYLWHLLANLIALYFFGRSVEEAIGSRSFLVLYLGSGVAGGLLQALLGWVSPYMFGGVTVGASAGALGLVAAFATLFPNRVITLLVFFVLPVSIRARTVAWIFAGLALFGVLVPQGNLADGAHLGGMIAGWAFIHYGLQEREWRWPRLKFTHRRVRVLSKPKRTAGQPTSARHLELETPMSEDFISQEVDPILDKISAHGMQSLTDREKRILDAAHNRMRRR